MFRISRLYIETSVINGVFSKDVRIRIVSSALFDKIRAGELEGHASSYVLAELYETPDVEKRAVCFGLRFYALPMLLADPRLTNWVENMLRRA